MSDQEFREILVAARKGHDWAIAALWRDVHPRLLRYLRRLAPGLAEDVESETWLCAARDLGAFHGTATDFRAWLFTIARHRLVDARRRAARRPSVAVPLEQLEDWVSLDDVETTALASIGTDEALALVATLPDDQAEVILLRVLGGLDTARVSAILRKRPGTVRVLQHRGLRQLATKLAEARPARGVTP